MLGVFVNTLAVIVGSTLGMLCKKGLPERLTSAIMIGIGLCTLYIGISGLGSSSSTLVIIFAVVLGAVIGTLLDIDRALSTMGQRLENRWPRKDNGSAPLAQGFVTASLLFCVGSMTITGSLTSGLTGDHSIIFAKSLLDLISSFILGASLGFGVLLSALFVLVFQGAIVLLASALAPVLTAAAIADMTCAGSLLVIALGLNILDITKIKAANYLPAILISPLITWIAELLGNLF